ncbi:histidine kinase, partial [Vibrio alginolyticus]|nr:histidine kinase [Vibrio alginolyticus]
EQADWQGVEHCCLQLGLQVNDVTQDLTAAARWSQDVNRVE